MSDEQEKEADTPSANEVQHPIPVVPQACQQCGKPAVFTDPSKGLLLCIDCYYKIQVIMYHRSQMLSNLGIGKENQLAVLAGITGADDAAPGLVPLHGLFSNITADTASICTVNIANLHALDICLEQVKNSGDPMLVSTLKTFVETVVEDPHLLSPQKDDLLERLAFVFNQLLAPRPQRKCGVVRAVLQSLCVSAAAITVLRPVWARLEPMAFRLLG